MDKHYIVIGKTITLVAPNTKAKGVARYNKPYNNYTSYSVYDRRWGTKSIGTNGAKDIFEMIVDGGKVVEFREGLPPASIPVNGYVVVTKTSNASFLKNNFAIGDNVILNISTTPDLQNTNMAITGGTLLIENGKVPSKFTHIPEGSVSRPNPRTAVGSSKDGKILYLVTVDGRQTGSIGMTLSELANYLKGIGVYNAINLDGGGSTTMVSRKPGTDNLDLVNNPSDGSQRAVINAIGIFSIAPPSELDGLIIDTVDSNIFVNTSRKFTVRGYDKYLNPVEIDPSMIKWSISGVSGSFKGATVIPTSVGVGKVTASVGSVSAKLTINCLASPTELILNDSEVALQINHTKSFTAVGKDLSGFTAYIDPSDVTWSIKGQMGTLNKNTLKATASGIGYIKARVSSAYSYSKISVETIKTISTDDFEKINGTFKQSQAEVTGSYQLSSEQAHSGMSSGKLSYDIPVLDNNRAAYINLSSSGIKLSQDTNKVGMWVYNTHENSNWIGAWFLDSKGNQTSLYFSKGMSWTGWKYLEIDLGSKCTYSKITRIYVVQTNPVPDSGCVYFDDLTLYKVYFPSTSSLHVPVNSVGDIGPVENIDYKQTSSSFRFSVLAQSGEIKTSSCKTFFSKFLKETNSKLDAAAILGASKYSSTSSVKKPVAATNTGYKSFDIKNSRFIQLDTSKKGLRQTSATEWHWLLDRLNSFKKDNVFIFIYTPPESFSDKSEGNLLYNILAKYKKDHKKNVWVFCKGSKNSVKMDRGVKYIYTPGLNSSGSNSSTKYIQVTVFGKLIYYQLK